MEIATNSKNNASVALLEKRKEMMIIQDALQNKRKNFDNKVDQLKQREKNLLHHRNELTETIINLDKYIKENDRKRTQNLMKVKTERMLCDKSENDMQNQIREMNQKLEEKAEKERMYHEYCLIFTIFFRSLFILFRRQNVSRLFTKSSIAPI